MEENTEITLEKLEELEKQTNDKFTKKLINDLKKQISFSKKPEIFRQLSYGIILDLIEHESKMNELNRYKLIKYKDIAYNLRIILDGKKREVLLNGEFLLNGISCMIQKEFDLEPMHLYEFEIGRYKFGPECDEWQEIFDCLDDFKIGAAISAAGLKIGDKFKFLYDFGDKIRFKIEIIDVKKLNLKIYGKYRQKPCR